MAYALQSNRVISEILEISAVDHCNLACRACDHLAPVSPRRAPHVAEMAEDLRRLSAVYHARTVRIMGGEPLLRPDIVAFTQMIRESGIADTVRIVTNGTLLPRFTPELFALLDSVEISIYPSAVPDAGAMAEFESQAEAAGVTVLKKETNDFHAAISLPGFNDAGLVDQIYRSCKIAHVWSCHTVYAGHFFKCSRAAHFDREILRRADFPSGVKIEAANFLPVLTAYLARPEPMPACRNCLGTADKTFPHSQTARADWRAFHEAPAESFLAENYRELLQEDFLAQNRELGITAGPFPEQQLFDLEK